MSISSCLSVCPCFDERVPPPLYARGLTASTPRAVARPLCYALCYRQLVARLQLDLPVSSPIPHTYTRSLLSYQHTSAQRHAPCCPPQHHPRHGPLDIRPIAKQCSPPARMGDQQCHVKSINSSRQCNTATPAPALLLWHTSTADRPPTKQSLASK